MKTAKQKTTVCFAMAYDPNITGVTIYEKQILQIFSKIQSVDIVVIRDSCPISHVESFYTDGVTYFHFPHTATHKTKTLITFLKCTINPCDKMIFFVNYLPGSFMMEALKQAYPHAVRCLVVHDIPWLTLCNGDVGTYLEYVNGNISSSKKTQMIKMITYDMTISLSLSHLVIALCKDTQDLLHSLYGISIDRIRLISNGLIDSYSFIDNHAIGTIRNSYNLPLDKYLAVFIGRISFSKGIDRIISLMEIMKRYALFTKWHIIYVGADDYAKWIPATYRDSISYVGYLPNKEVINLLSACNIGIIASRHEQCSYTGIEMLMSNLPILYMPNSYGVENMFANTGIPINNCITFLENYPIMSEEGCSRKKYLSSYTYNIMEEKYRSILDELLALC